MFPTSAIHFPYHASLATLRVLLVDAIQVGEMDGSFGEKGKTTSSQHTRLLF